jgi:hypothetical protein
MQVIAKVAVGSSSKVPDFLYQQSILIFHFLELSMIGTSVIVIGVSRTPA